MNWITLRGYLAVISLTAVSSLTLAAEEREAAVARAPQSRTFRMNYAASVNELPVGARVRIWFPMPRTNGHQQVRILRINTPTRPTIPAEPTYDNKILYCEVRAPSSGTVKLGTSYRVQRREVRALAADGEPAELTDEQKKRFLSANEKVPLKGKQLKLLDGLTFSNDPLEVARTLYDRVDSHVRYDKSQPGYGQGDVSWVCDSRFGNCTDFHSLFISLARAKGLPARFEIGFPLPPERGEGTIAGYHCWAMFHRGKQGWVPVDISEASKHPELKRYYFGNLTENRVTFTVGRDIRLVPEQDGPPLNFFVYPYVEVDGKPWPKTKSKSTFSFADIEDIQR